MEEFYMDKDIEVFEIPSMNEIMEEEQKLAFSELKTDECKLFDCFGQQL